MEEKAPYIHKKKTINVYCTIVLVLSGRRTFSLLASGYTLPRTGFLCLSMKTTSRLSLVRSLPPSTTGARLPVSNSGRKMELFQAIMFAFSTGTYLGYMYVRVRDSVPKKCDSTMHVVFSRNLCVPYILS
jgi:hypothetical protein